MSSAREQEDQQGLLGPIDGVNAVRNRVALGIEQMNSIRLFPEYIYGNGINLAAPESVAGAQKS